VETAERLIAETIAQVTRSPESFSLSGSSHSNSIDTILIPNNMVGLLVGRQGSTIQALEEATGCRISTAPRDELQGSSERTVTFRGTLEQIQQGKAAVQTLVAPVAYTKGSGSGSGRPGSGSGKLIVRNLSFHCTDDELQEIFAEYGVVSEVRIPKDPEKKNCSRGFGFVQFADRATAETVVQALRLPGEQLVIRGRPVAVDFSVPKTKSMDLQEEQQAAQPHVAALSGEQAARQPPGQIGSGLWATKVAEAVVDLKVEEAEEHFPALVAIDAQAPEPAEVGTQATR